MTALKNQAIEKALVGDWKNAIAANQELLKENPEDIEALNRLAFAYMALGKSKSAKDCYGRVLSLDSENPIAIKNLKRLEGSKTKKPNGDSKKTQITNLFIEEPGKTKVIELVNVTQPNIITELRTGEPLDLKVKRLKIFVMKDGKQFIGMFPDDIGIRLIRLINGGNEYDACVKSAEGKKVCIFVRETRRTLKFKNQPSFLQGSDKSRLILSKEFRNL